MTPSHQSDLLDTLMCELRFLGGKDVEVYGDEEYKDYNTHYRDTHPKKNPYINSFKIDLKELLEKGGQIEAFREKLFINFPLETKNIGDKKNYKSKNIPSFVCEINKIDKRGMDYVDIDCHHEWENMVKDYKEFMKKNPHLPSWF